MFIHISAEVTPDVKYSNKPFMAYFVYYCRCDTSKWWGEDYGDIQSSSVRDFSSHYPAGYLTVQHKTLPVHRHWELHSSPENQVVESFDCIVTNSQKT